MTNTKSTEAQWWHAHGTEIPDLGWAMAVIGPTPLGPDAYTKTGKSVRDWTVPFDGHELPWLHAWDHEPSDVEKETVTPEEFRDEEESPA